MDTIDFNKVYRRKREQLKEQFTLHIILMNDYMMTLDSDRWSLAITCAAPAVVIRDIGIKKSIVLRCEDYY